MDMRSYSMFQELVRVIERYRHQANIEIEIRLGWKSPERFDTNVGESFFEIAHETLRNSGLQRAVQDSSVYTHGVLRKVVTRDGRTDVHKKKRLEAVDFNILGTPYDARVSVCQEIPVRSKANHEWCFLRNRHRTIYEYKMWRYDLTKCALAKPVDAYAEDLVSYEIELELDVSKATGHSSSYLAHAAVVKIIDLVEMNKSEKINLKSIDICSNKNTTITKTINQQSKWLPRTTP